LVVGEEEKERERKRKEKGKGRADPQEEEEYESSSQEEESQEEESQEAVAEKQKKRNEMSREEMERIFGSAVGGLLSNSEGEGDEVARERREAGLGKPGIGLVRKKKEKGKEREKEKGKEKEKKKVRIKRPKAFPNQELLDGGVEVGDGAGESSKGTKVSFASRRSRAGSSQSSLESKRTLTVWCFSLF